MILRAFLLALGQLGDPRFLRVVLLGVALSLALLAGIYALFLAFIEWGTPGSVTIPWIGPIGGLHSLLSIGSALMMLVFSVFLMVPVASAFVGIFIEDVADAVEDRHYPGLPPARAMGAWQAIKDSINFLGVLIVVNLLALALYTISGPLIPLFFWAVNGFLLGWEYFTMVASRRLGRNGAIALRRRHVLRIWAAGVLMTAPLSIPLVNLVIPVLGVATFTHLFHALLPRNPDLSTG